MGGDASGALPRIFVCLVTYLTCLCRVRRLPLQGADDKQERAIAKLKEGWAAELRRQKEGWAAAEKQRREAWMAAKATEIKDMTVKGLEGEVRAPRSRAFCTPKLCRRRRAAMYMRHSSMLLRQVHRRCRRHSRHGLRLST